MRFVIPLLAFVLTAMAADITGRWKGEYEVNGEKLTTVFDFKQNEDKLSGTVTPPQGQPEEIRDGKINVTEFTFYVLRKAQGRDQKVQYRGVVAGNMMRLKGTIAGTGQSLDIMAERQ